MLGRLKSVPINQGRLAGEDPMGALFCSALIDTFRVCSLGSLQLDNLEA